MRRVEDAPALWREGARVSRWSHAAALVVLSVMLVGTMWVVPYLPTNDGPEWIFATHAENHYSDPGAPYRDALIPTLQFASRGMSVVYAPLEAWLGWERGLQVALSLVVLATAWGFVALARALHRDRLALGFLGFPLALSWELYIGLWPFVISGAIGLFIVALAVGWREPGWKGRAMLSLLLFLQAIAHVFGAVLTGCAILALSLARAPRGKRLGELALTALVGVPAMGILLATVVVSSGLAKAPLAADFQRLPWRDVLTMFPRTVAPGPLARALVVTLGVLIAGLVALLRARRQDTDAADRGLGLAAVILLLTAVFAPYQIPGWQAFSPRFLPLGVALAFAVFPLEAIPLRARRLAPGVIFVASALSLGQTYPFHRRLVELCPDAIKGLETSFRTKGQILSVLFRATEQPTYDHIRAEVPFLIPLRHMGSLYATVLGGVPASSFTGDPAIHAFLRRPSARPLPEQASFWGALTSLAFSHDRVYRDQVLEKIATLGVFYDEVALFGAIPSDFALWHERGYIDDWRSTTTLVAHFEPCTIDVTVPATRATTPPTFDVRVGDVTLLSQARVPGVVGGDGAAHFTLAPAPCGKVAVRVRWDGEIGDRRFCNNADGEGEILGRVTREMGVVPCEAE
jgi:hypothetical protein